MSVDREDLRLVELCESLAWVGARSRFYREKMAAAGVELGDVRTWEDFRRLPLTRKSEVPAAQRREPPFGPLLAVGEEEVASVSISPGPLYIPRMSREPTGVEALHQSLEHMQVRPDDVAHVTLSYHIMPGGLRLHRAFESFGCRVINGGVGSSEMQVRVASDLGATVYAGTPSFLARLADVAEAEQRPLRYRVGFSTAEKLTPAIRDEMGRRLGIELFDHCGEALIGPLAGECRAHQGMHLHDREMIVELIDPETGESAQPGGVGELVVTQLGPRAMPLVRYAPGDLFLLRVGECACGETTPRIEFRGQVGAIRKIKGVLVHPDQVREALRSVPGAGAFRIHVEPEPDARHERVRIRVHCPAASEDTAARLAERLRSQLMIQMEVELAADDRDLGNDIVDHRHG